MQPFDYPFSKDHKPYAKCPPKYANLNVEQPVYQDITATYIPGHVSQQLYSSLPQNQNGIIVIQPIMQGIPVTSADQAAINQGNARVDIQSRRQYWNYSRRAQNFICLNVCYVIILIISINSSFSEYKDYEHTCPNFSKANLLFAVLGVIWILSSVLGVYASSKRSEKMLKAYIGVLYGILVVTVIITAYGLLNKDEGSECDSDDSPPKSISLIGNALFTIFILGLFAYTATKLRKMLTPPPPQPRI